MNVVYTVGLTADEREALRQRVSSGKGQARAIKRAQILLACDQGASEHEIARLLSCGTATIYRVKKRFVEEGLEEALGERSRPGARRKLSGREEAVLVALACSKPPTGRACWTLELLAGELVRLVVREGVSRETVRRRLAEKDIKPWQEKMWCIPCVDAEFVERMEDVLDLYAEEHDPCRPVVCFDEKPYQLIGETRAAVPAKPGQRARIDYEYVRNGTANIFVMLDANRGWRHAKVTDHRGNIDFAECMRELADVHYPNASTIRVVLDNLSTHRAKNLYEAFPAAEARRILRRLEFHYTPKHASWLNMVEIEIGVLSRQCLARRIPDRASLEVQVEAWTRARNDDRSRIEWLFAVDDARRKLGHAYPIALFSAPISAAA
jgi:transposase